MRLIIVLCLGTLVWSAPAPQVKKQIDFAWQLDDETLASVTPVEANTVEPKVTATKITDPRKAVPIYEEEEEAEVREEEREPSPTASPLNTVQVESSDDADTDEQENNADGEQNQEIDEPNDQNEVRTTEGAIIDTTIRVYDEEELSGKKSDEEEAQQIEHQQQQQQEENQSQEEEKQQEENQQTGEEERQLEEQIQVRQNANNQEESGHEEDQQVELNDSYQYDDESLEQQLQAVRNEEEKVTTVVPEVTTAITVTDAGYEIAVNGGSLVVDKDTFVNLNGGKLEPPKWFHGPPDSHVPHWHRGQQGDKQQGPPHGHIGPHNHSSYADGSFDSAFHGPPPPGHPFGGSPPHGHFGPHNHSNYGVGSLDSAFDGLPPPGHPFGGSPPPGHPFGGSPPPWHDHPNFNQDHPHNHNHHFKGYDGSKRHHFHDNAFHRGNWAPWSSRKTTVASTEVTSTKVNNLFN